MNGQSTVHNYCTIHARGYAHADVEFHNHGIIVAGLNGNGTGFNNQGTTTLYDGSYLLTKNFYWSPNRPLALDGDATIAIAESNMDANGEILELYGDGKLRMNQGVRLTGSGALEIIESTPNSQGDNPTGGHLNFPASWEQMVNCEAGTSSSFRALTTDDTPPVCEF